jgi:CDP-diglyceride synthetase
MRKRVLLSLIIVPALALIVYLPYLHAIGFLVFTFLLSILTSREIRLLTEHVFARKSEGFEGEFPGRWRLLYAAPAVLLVAAAYANQVVILPRGIILYGGGVLAGCVILASIFDRGPFFPLAASGLASLVCAGAIPALMYLIRAGRGGVVLTFFTFTVPWISDSAAFLIGSRFGRHRGIVRASPNKSVEGYAGSVPCALMAAAGYGLLLPGYFPLSPGETIILGFLLGLSAPLGDLVESVFKRRAGVKDSSQLLPGMGGVLDVFDSVFFSVPVVFIYSRLVWSV